MDQGIEVPFRRHVRNQAGCYLFGVCRDRDPGATSFKAGSQASSVVVTCRRHRRRRVVVVCFASIFFSIHDIFILLLANWWFRIMDKRRS